MTDDTARRAILTDDAPRPVAQFSPGLSLHGITQVSGQGPLDAATGTVQHPDDIAAQTQLTLHNVSAILDAGGLSFADVAMVRVYLAERAHFGAMNAAYDAFMREQLGSIVPPARTTLIVGLPLEGMLVEIDALAVVSASARRGE